MGHLLRSFVIVAALVAAAPSVVAFDAPAQSGGAKKAPAAANAKPGSAAAGKKEEDSAASKAQKLLDTGIAAYDAGKIVQAIRAFDAAINGGALKSQQMARALYYRGLSYSRKGEPAIAIPDLTSAIWLKDGLSASERQQAIASRVAAYRDAGVADAPPAPQPTGLAATSIGLDGWQTSDAPTGFGAEPSNSASAAVSTRQTASFAPARPPPPPPQTTSSSSGGGFFSSIASLFGGGSSSSNSSSSNSSSSQEVTTSAIHEAPAADTWSQTTQVATASPPAAAPPPPAAPPQAFATQTQVTAVAPPIHAQPQPQASTALTGKYQVQVAAVRSRDEAYALSVRLLSQHGSELGARRPKVDETVIGSMGTFYRVTVGPFASAEESQRMCGSLRTGGFDCLVISQ